MLSTSRKKINLLLKFKVIKEKYDRVVLVCGVYFTFLSEGKRNKYIMYLLIIKRNLGVIN